MCVCVWVRGTGEVCICVCMWRLFSSIISIMFYLFLSWSRTIHWTWRSPLRLDCHHLSRAGPKGIHCVQLFEWVPRIQAHLSMSVWQALYWLSSYFPAPDNWLFSRAFSHLSKWIKSRSSLFLFSPFGLQSPSPPPQCVSPFSFFSATLTTLLIPCFCCLISSFQVSLSWSSAVHSVPDSQSKLLKV